MDLKIVCQNVRWVPAGVKTVQFGENQRTLESTGFFVVDHPPTVGLLQQFMWESLKNPVGRFEKNAEGYWRLVDKGSSPEKLGGFDRQRRDPSTPVRVEVISPTVEGYKSRLNHLGEEEQNRRLQKDQPALNLEFFEAVALADWVKGRLMTLEEHQFAALSGAISPYSEWAQVPITCPRCYPRLAICRPHDELENRKSVHNYYTEIPYDFYLRSTFRIAFSADHVIASGVLALPDTSPPSY